MTRTLSQILFLALVLDCGLLLGFLTAPGEWYPGPAKLPFNPPTWLSGLVWTVLFVFVFIAIAGSRVRQRDRAGWPTELRWAELALNFHRAQSFAAHQIGLALVVILLMLAAVLGFIVTAWQPVRVAAVLFVLCWLGCNRFGTERLDLGIDLR